MSGDLAQNCEAFGAGLYGCEAGEAGVVTIAINDEMGQPRQLDEEEMEEFVSSLEDEVSGALSRTVVQQELLEPTSSTPRHSTSF
jgi:hypothetical protein